jgi:hypothetical protein
MSSDGKTKTSSSLHDPAPKHAARQPFVIPRETPCHHGSRWPAQKYNVCNDRKKECQLL